MSTNMLTRRHFLMSAAIAPQLDAKQDRTTLIFEGKTPNKLCCDTTLRRMPDGSWVMLMLGGGDTEPLPANDLFLSRSHDEGRTWSAMTPIDLGIKKQNPNRALVPSELMVYGKQCWMFFANHNGKFDLRLRDHARYFVGQRRYEPVINAELLRTLEGLARKLQ